MAGSWFHEQLAYIADVTAWLNRQQTPKGFYLHVELREEGSHAPVGRWSDEISGEDWYFEEVSG
jgi:hypothetical protein